MTIESDSILGSRKLQICRKVTNIGSTIGHRISLLLRRFVFRMAEASAKRVTGDTPQGTMGRVQTRQPQNSHNWGGGTEMPAAHTKRKLTKVPPPPPAA